VPDQVYININRNTNESSMQRCKMQASMELPLFSKVNKISVYTSTLWSSCSSYFSGVLSVLVKQRKQIANE
jgi:hypothetical protein